MYELTIHNPNVEALVRDLYEAGNLAEDPAFIAFLQKKKVIRDLRESYSQFKNGQAMTADETFSSLYNELGL